MPLRWGQSRWMGGCRCQGGGWQGSPLGTFGHRGTLGVGRSEVVRGTRRCVGSRPLPWRHCRWKGHGRVREREADFYALGTDSDGDRADGLMPAVQAFAREPILETAWPYSESGNNGGKDWREGANVRGKSVTAPGRPTGYGTCWANQRRRRG